MLNARNLISLLLSVGPLIGVLSCRAFPERSEEETEFQETEVLLDSTLASDSELVVSDNTIFQFRGLDVLLPGIWYCGPHDIWTDHCVNDQGYVVFEARWSGRGSQTMQSLLENYKVIRLDTLSIGDRFVQVAGDSTTSTPNTVIVDMGSGGFVTFRAYGELLQYFDEIRESIILGNNESPSPAP